MNAPIAPGESWKLTVFGHPTGQGSISAVAVMRTDHTGKKVPVLGKNGYPITNVKDQKAKRLKPWRNEIASMCVTSGDPRPWPALGLAMLDEAVIVRLVFYVARPDNHFGTGRNAGVLKDSSPLYPAATGDDVDKLARSVLDALTGIVYRSDKRVITLPARRRYGTPERVEITVRRPRAQTVGELRRLRDINPILAETIDNELQLDLFAALPKKAVA